MFPPSKSEYENTNSNLHTKFFNNAPTLLLPFHKYKTVYDTHYIKRKHFNSENLYAPLSHTAKGSTHFPFLSHSIQSKPTSTLYIEKYLFYNKHIVPHAVY